MHYHHIFGLKSKKIKTLGLGIFDGMHLGHQEIARNCTALLTFYPHPDIFLKKNKQLKMLSTLRESRVYFKNLLVLRFSEEIACLRPEEFLNLIILDIIKPKCIIVGEDFQFGYKQMGTVATLKKWGDRNNVQVRIIPLCLQNNQLINSSAIRQLIAQDKFDEALKLFGHPYLIMGKVVPGAGRGKSLGFPTANLKVPVDKLCPPKGVYLAKLLLGARTSSLEKHLAQAQDCLVYIGKRPTFNDNKFSIEVHIPNHDSNLYNKIIKVFLTKKLREEIAFSSRAELIGQIKKDLSGVSSC